MFQVSHYLSYKQVNDVTKMLSFSLHKLFENKIDDMKYL